MNHNTACHNLEQLARQQHLAFHNILAHGTRTGDKNSL